MKPVRVLIFGIDDLFPALKAYYDREVERGNMEITGYVAFQGDQLAFAKNLNGEPLQELSFDKVIISSQNTFMLRYKLLKQFTASVGGGGGIGIKNVIQGTLFAIPEIDFQRFLIEGNVYGHFVDANFSNVTWLHYPRIWNYENTSIKIGVKSYVCGINITGLFNRSLSIGNFSALAGGIIFRFACNGDHDYESVSNYPTSQYEWRVPNVMEPENCPKEPSKIIIGNDVWIGASCHLKVSNNKKPLIIGDGAVIASDSVVVKDVPPYAIVGGNPAKFIKWRFDEETIERLKRIQWWNWDLEKIYDNFHYFKDPVEFAKRFDIER